MIWIAIVAAGILGAGTIAARRRRRARGRGPSLRVAEQDEDFQRRIAEAEAGMARARERAEPLFLVLGGGEVDIPPDLEVAAPERPGDFGLTEASRPWVATMATMLPGPVRTLRTRGGEDNPSYTIFKHPDEVLAERQEAYRRYPIGPAPVAPSSTIGDLRYLRRLEDAADEIAERLADRVTWMPRTPSRGWNYEQGYAAQALAELAGAWGDELDESPLQLELEYARGMFSDLGQAVRAASKADTPRKVRAARERMKKTGAWVAGAWSQLEEYGEAIVASVVGYAILAGAGVTIGGAVGTGIAAVGAIGVAAGPAFLAALVAVGFYILISGIADVFAGSHGGRFDPHLRFPRRETPGGRTINLDPVDVERYSTALWAGDQWARRIAEAEAGMSRARARAA